MLVCSTCLGCLIVVLHLCSHFVDEENGTVYPVWRPAQASGCMFQLSLPMLGIPWPIYCLLNSIYVVLTGWGLTDDFITCSLVIVLLEVCIYVVCLLRKDCGSVFMIRNQKSYWNLCGISNLMQSYLVISPSRRFGAWKSEVEYAHYTTVNCSHNFSVWTG